MRKRRKPRSGWSLLGKELIEQAARRQTYIVRVLYALLLFGAFAAYYQSTLPQTQGDILGRGAGIFQFLVVSQAIAIFVFLPPMMAGAIAYEKERDSLVLLMLTDLSPGELIIQKYIGRLVPMLTFLFLSLPLMAVAYSLGGVSFGMLCGTSLGLLTTCLIVGAFTIMCSAYSASTFQALVRCYTLGLLFMMFCGVFIVPQFILPRVGGGPSIVGSILHLFICFITVMTLLHRAKRHLVARAFVAQRNPFAEQFKGMDRFWRDTRKLVRGILWAEDKESYAEAAKLVAGGRRSRTGGKRWSLFSFLMGDVQVPGLLAAAIIIGGTVGIIMFVVMILGGNGTGFVSVIVFGLWGVALLTVPIQGANAIASERMNQRLDVLLTTPMTADEILHQRTTAVRRWIRFLTWPLLAMVLFGAWGRREGQPFHYLIAGVASVLVYLPLMQWVSLFIGLRIRSQVRALFLALALTVGWCLVPWALIQVVRDARWITVDVPWNWLGLISPGRMVVIMEADSAKNHFPNTIGLVILVNFMVYGGLLWLMRKLCFRKADICLGRAG